MRVINDLKEHGKVSYARADWRLANLSRADRARAPVVILAHTDAERVAPRRPGGPTGRRKATHAASPKRGQGRAVVNDIPSLIWKPPLPFATL